MVIDIKQGDVVLVNCYVCSHGKNNHKHTGIILRKEFIHKSCTLKILLIKDNLNAQEKPYIEWYSYKGKFKKYFKKITDDDLQKYLWETKRF